MSSQKEIYKDFQDNNNYKIRCGYPYTITRNDYLGRTYYSIQVTKKNSDGTETHAFKGVKFKNREKGEVDIKDGTVIIPLKIYEDFYFKNNNKFVPMFTLDIYDWEYAETEKEKTQNAVEDFRKSVAVNDIMLNDDDLPF